MSEESEAINMDATALTIEQIVCAVKLFNYQERQQFLAALADIDELWEDMKDMFLILSRRDEPSRPYSEFVAELKSEGRL